MNQEKVRLKKFEHKKCLRKPFIKYDEQRRMTQTVKRSKQQNEFLFLDNVSYEIID